MLDSINIDWSFLWDRNKPSLQSQFTSWLYSDWSEQKIKDYDFLNMLPGVHQYMDYLLDVRADTEYLNRYDMDYSDVHDPRKLHQTNSAAGLYGVGYRMVSKNLSRLYK